MEHRNYDADELDCADDLVKVMNPLREQVVLSEEAIEVNRSKIDELSARFDDLLSKPKATNKPKASKPTKSKSKSKPTKGKGKKGTVGMKTLVGMAIIALLFISTCAFGANITFEEAAETGSLIRWLNRNVNTDTYLFTPLSSAPTGIDLAEGRVYYNDGTNTLYFSPDGTTWTAIGAASGNSLDEAYNSSSKITVDAGVIEFEAADSLGVAALLIDYDDATTNAMDAMQITNAGDDGAAVSLQIDSTAGYDIQGTGDLWNVSYVGLGLFKGGLTLNTGGELLVSARDVLFDDTYDVAWDTDQDMLIFQDNAELGFGGDHDGAADLTFKGDGTNVLIEVATEDAADLLIGYTNGLDVKFHAATNTSFMLWDESGAELIFDIADILMGDEDEIALGDSDDFVIYYNETTSDNLIIATAVDNDAVQIGDGTTNTDLKLHSSGTDTAAFTWFDASGDTNNGQMKFGVDDHGQDVLFYGATATQVVWWDQSLDTWYFGTDAEGVDVYTYGDTTVNYMFWDESDNRLEFVAADIFLDDNGDIILGSGLDWLVECDAAKTLEFIPVTTDGTAAFHIGTAAATSDVLIYGETASELITWDAGADSLTVVADLALFTMTGTTKPFHVNVTGTVAGIAAALETSNGGITLLADGAANGDINIDAADVITLVSTDSDGTAIYLHANGGTSEVIKIHADQGNTAASIHLASDVGGITLDGAVGGVVFTAGQTRSIIFMPNDVKIDGTTGPGTTDIGTSTQAQFDTLGFDVNPDTTGDDYVFINWIVPAGYIANSADLHCYWSFSTAEAETDECVIDGTVNAVAPGEDLDIAGTAMAAVTSVITHAGTEEGSLVKTSLDIEVEDIEVEDIAVGDMVCIAFFFDEDSCAMDASGTADVHYFEITYESTE